MCWDCFEQRQDPRVPLCTQVQGHQAHLGAKGGWFGPTGWRKERSGWTRSRLSHSLRCSLGTFQLLVKSQHKYQRLTFGGGGRDDG